MSYTFKKINKNSKAFICALCSTNRSMRYSKNLKFVHYLQIVIIVSSLTLLFWSTFAINTLLVAPVVWSLFETTNKLLYRRDVPCPNCGFDATWYRRDVKIAKNKVEQFWLSKEQSKFDRLNKGSLESPETLM